MKVGDKVTYLDYPAQVIDKKWSETADEFVYKLKYTDENGTRKTTPYLSKFNIEN